MYHQTYIANGYNIQCALSEAQGTPFVSRNQYNFGPGNDAAFLRDTLQPGSKMKKDFDFQANVEIKITVKDAHFLVKMKKLILRETFCLERCCRWEGERSLSFNWIVNRCSTFFLNINAKQSKIVALINHNLSNYDSRLFIKKLNKFKKDKIKSVALPDYLKKFI